MFLPAYLTAYQATKTETTANANTTASKTTIPILDANGTKKSTNPMGKAIRNNRLFRRMTAMKQRYPQAKCIIIDETLSTVPKATDLKASEAGAKSPEEFAFSWL